MTLAERPAPIAAASFTLPVAALDLQATVDGGQAFRWWEVAGSNGTAFDGVIGRVAVRLSVASSAAFPPPPRRGRDGERVSQPEAGRSSGEPTTSYV